MSRKKPVPRSPGQRIDELQIVLEDPAPLDDDDDDDDDHGVGVHTITTTEHIINQIITDLIELRFFGAEAFVAKNDPAAIMEALNDVAPRAGPFSPRHTRPDVKNPAGLIRWLVKQAQP